jgi:hypothetical protein
MLMHLYRYLIHAPVPPVKFSLLQVPSFHKLFKSLPPTNKEKMADDRESVFNYDNYHGVSKKASFLPIFVCKCT